MRISVAMPHYNREEKLLRGIESILEHNDLDLRFSIADDRSRPPLAYSCFAGLDAEVRLNWIMGSPEPLNPCAPINLAVNRAIKHQEPDLIVLTTPEIVHKSAVLTLMAAAMEVTNVEHPYITARCEDERGCIAGVEVDYSKDGRLPVPEGAHFHFLAMFSPDLWEKAGGFDEDYREVQGCDDNDWLWRCKEAGATFFHLEHAVFHEKSTTKWNMPHGRELFFEKWPELRP